MIEPSGNKAVSKEEGSTMTSGFTAPVPAMDTGCRRSGWSSWISTEGSTTSAARSGAPSRRSAAMNRRSRGSCRLCIGNRGCSKISSKRHAGVFTEGRCARRLLTLPPVGKVSGRRCPHRPWNGVGMATRKGNGVASKHYTFDRSRPLARWRSTPSGSRQPGSSGSIRGPEHRWTTSAGTVAGRHHRWWTQPR